MTGKDAAGLLRQQLHFLDNTLSGFKPEHGDFRPKPEMMSVAQQINHIAGTTHWFQEGAFGAGFDVDFEKMEAENRRKISLEEAKANLARAYEAFATLVAGQSEAALTQLLPDNPILGKVPRMAAVFANADHTAHHRGSLAVYLRLLGVTPTMVYAP